MMGITISNCSIHCAKYIHFMSINISKGTSNGSLSTNSLPTINYSLQAGKYLITQNILGEGGFGCVYKGKILKNGADVAIKICEDFEVAAVEDRISSKIQGGIHSLKYYGSFFTQERKPALVYQEFGVSLKQFMKNSEIPLPLPSVVQVFKSIVECVIEFKELGVIHRDLKTDNILIKKKNERNNIFDVKLCDLGLASQIEQDQSKVVLAKLGTIFYKSPETVHFGENTFKSQVWSLGIIFYQTLYGKFPFQKQVYKNEQNLYHKLILNPIIFQQVPQIIREIGEACLNPNSQKRISLEQLRNKLNFISEELKNPKSSLASEQNRSLFDQITIQSILHQLSKLFDDLKIRLQSLRGVTTLEKKIIMMCKQVAKNKFTSAYQFLEQINKTLLLEFLKKMKIMAKFTRSQRHIRFNLKEFMAIDTLLLLLKLLLNLERNELDEISKNLSKYFMENTSQQNIFLRCCNVFDQLTKFQQ